MAQRLLIAGGAVIVLGLAIVAFTVFRTPESASAPIAALPITEATTASTAPATTEPPTASPAPAIPEVTTASTAAAAAEATQIPTASGQTSTASASQIFEIVSAESEARFLIDEVLRGAPVTVIGATDQVAGQIALDPSAPQVVKVGTIQINARTLATDNDFRNRAIKNAILQTDSFEFITFTPTTISGMPESVTVGTPFSFQMSGDLTVKDTTKAVTFEVTVTPMSETEISGTATTSVQYRELGLTIPDSPAVDTIADDVRLELTFIARSVA